MPVFDELNWQSVLSFYQFLFTLVLVSVLEKALRAIFIIMGGIKKLFFLLSVSRKKLRWSKKGEGGGAKFFY